MITSLLLKNLLEFLRINVALANGFWKYTQKQTEEIESLHKLLVTTDKESEVKKGLFLIRKQFAEEQYSVWLLFRPCSFWDVHSYDSLFEEYDRGTLRVISLIFNC